MAKSIPHRIVDGYVEWEENGVTYVCKHEGVKEYCPLCGYAIDKDGKVVNDE